MTVKSLGGAFRRFFFKHVLRANHLESSQRKYNLICKIKYFALKILLQKGKSKNFKNGKKEKKKNLTKSKD